MTTVPPAETLRGRPPRWLTTADVHAFVGAAVRAPSVHNSQPWRFRLVSGAVELWADRSRQLLVADPLGRELTISCGAALYTLQVAIRAAGQAPVVQLLPDAAVPDLLARIAAGAKRPPSAADRRLYAAIFRRHTHRGRFPGGPVGGPLIDDLVEVARRNGAELRVVESPGVARRLHQLLAAAERRQRAVPQWRQELIAWTAPPDSRSRDGVPAFAYPLSRLASAAEPPVRDFDLERGWGAAGPPGVDDALLAALLSAGDGPADWLASGRALQAVLLHAATQWAFAGIFTQALELSYLRQLVGEELDRGTGRVQVLLRLGYAPNTRPTPRRPIDEVLDSPMTEERPHAGDSG